MFDYYEPPSEGLKQYAAELYARRADAAIVPRVNVDAGAWMPIANECHDNCDTWCAEHPDYEVVRGWLYFHLTGLSFCRFVSHSIVRRIEDGALMDITPSAAQPYPFLPALLSEQEYAEAAAVLQVVHGNGNLDFER